MAYRKRFCIRLLIVFIVIDQYGFIVTTNVQLSGAEYLQNAVRDLMLMNSAQPVSTYIENTRKINNYSPIRRADLSVNENDYRTKRTHSHDSNIPSLSLTKNELSALYQAAIANGQTVTLNDYDGSGTDQIHAAVHELHDSDNTVSSPDLLTDSNSPGYYYYYYPLKSFLNGIQNEVPKDNHVQNTQNHIQYGKQRPTLHAHHTHQHNIKIEAVKAVMEPAHKSKALEPLFMAISGFVGMAIMFMFSMILLPRIFGGKHRKYQKRSRDSELASYAAAINDIIEQYNKVYYPKRRNDRKLKF